MGVFLDLFIVGLFGIFIIVGIKSGFVRAIVRLLGSFGALIIASLLARPIASGIFDLFVKGWLTDKINTGLTSAGSSAASERVSSILGGLPGFVGSYVESANLEGHLETAVTGAAKSATSTVVSLLSPLFISFIQFIVFILLFLVALLVIKVFRQVLEGLFRAPVLSSVNRALGGAFGALQAFILCLVIGVVLFLIAPQPGERSLVSAETLNQSSVFSYFYSTDNLLISVFSDL